MDRVQGKVRAISGRERAGRWEKRAVRKGRGMKRGKRKIILGELPVYGQLSRFFGIGAEPDRRKGGSHTKRADVNWGEVRRKYESGMYTYQRLAREYHVCTQTVWRHAIKGQWQIGREEAEKQILRRCLMATAKLLETAAAGATERLESGEGSLKEVKELGGILQALVGTAAKMCQSEKNNDTAVNEIRVIMSEEVEALSG